MADRRDVIESFEGRHRLFCRRRNGTGIVVLIHGLGLSGESFRSAWEHPSLSKHGLLIPDLIGFGRSAVPSNEFDYELMTQAAAVWEVCDALDIREISLVGHSMGGTVAACMAKQRPQAVKCLISAEGNLTREPTAWSAKISAAGEKDFADEFRELANSKRFPAIKQTSLTAFVRSARSLQETPEREALRAFLAQRVVPVYFLRGDQPVSEVESLALCKDLEIPVRTIPDCGHFFTDDNPDGFYREIADILAAEEQRIESTRQLGDRRLTLLNQISRSNIATVWEAYDAELDRKVLVKYINPQYSRDDEIRARFLREAKAIAKLSHPNVVQIYDLRSDDGRLSLILEFVEGISLRKLLKDRGPLPPHLAVTIAAEIAAGLEHAHAAGIIHRDLKPENVMVSHAAEIKITDFGLVTLRDQPSLTQEGMLVGTPAYMAPEQVDGAELSPATDIFALGLILLEMLTGRRLFERNTLQATLQAVQSYKQLQTTDFGENTPAALVPVLSQLLERSAAKRFDNAGIVRDSLSRVFPEGILPRTLLADFLSGKPVRYATAQSVARARAWTWPLRIASVAALTLLGGGLLFYFAVLMRTPLEVQGPPVEPFESEQTAQIIQPQEPDTAIPKTEPREKLAEKPVAESPSRRVDTSAVIPTGEIKPAIGYLSLATKPWASIYFGDSLAGTTPLPGKLTLSAGHHRILLLNPEIGIPVQRDVEVRPNETTDYSVNLFDYVSRIRAASVKPWADVYINGEFVFRTPSAKIIYKPLGTHQITLRNPDYPEFTEIVTFREGDPVYEIRVDLVRR